MPTNIDEIERFEILLRTAYKVRRHLLTKQDVKEDDVVIDEDRMRELVAMYASCIHKYKDHHGYTGTLAGAPKRAAFTCAAIMVYSPFVSPPNNRPVQSVHAVLANQRFAWRVVTNYLRLDINSMPSEIGENFMHNLKYGLIENDQVNCRFVGGWIVGFLSLLQLKYGKI